jgi:hypothetical protein
MYPKMKLDIFSIFFQFITLGYCGKPKTVNFSLKNNYRELRFHTP